MGLGLAEKGLQERSSVLTNHLWATTILMLQCMQCHPCNTHTLALTSARSIAEAGVFDMLAS